MIVRELNVSTQEYARLLAGQGLSAGAAAEIEAGVREFPDVHVFGSLSTGRAFKQVLGPRFVSFLNSDMADRDNRLGCACILIGAAPTHYEDILRTIRSCYDAPGLVVVLPFIDLFADPLQVILETQPRSLTGYVRAGLIGGCNLSLASVFENEAKNFTGTVVKKKNVFFNLDGMDRRFLVKSHFFNMVRGESMLRNASIIRLISYPIDAYYLWGRMIRNQGQRSDEAYRLTSDSAEWQELRDNIHLNRQWLLSLKDAFHLRYEDFVQRREETVGALCAHVGTDCRAGFKPLQVLPYRTYFAGNPLDFMDGEVFRCLCSEFAAVIAHFYPEKRAEAEQALAGR